MGYNEFMDKSFQEEFIATVSHELRTPLTSIRGFAQTMLNSYEQIDDESKKKFLKIIEDQSNRLINLVENMLCVNKLNSINTNFVLKNINSNKEINPIIAIIKQQYPNHNFVIEFNEKIPEIYVDKDKFQQIITNLLENACKYSPEKSDIKIRTNFSENPNFVSIKIIDEGIGIERENLDKIFNKFSRIDNPLTRKTEGSGLGLYITKNLVDKMNGEIKVESSKKGSVFELLLPASNIEKQVSKICEKSL